MTARRMTPKRLMMNLLRSMPPSERVRFAQMYSNAPIPPLPVQPQPQNTPDQVTMQIDTTTVRFCGPHAETLAGVLREHLGRNGATK